ncbi:MAG: hypothetical protein KIT35_21980 [Piscinibacter sp.]|uniref:hypothetical protein n=1 Tax=Piscinibacter sp. TaxID=1903157 RepID=UPI002585EF22|nr:hypothetical protein [Piscinibacter sp.]MCW5666510.1 hypothetical protein [Piscinibacter sp.]
MSEAKNFCWLCRRADGPDANCTATCPVKYPGELPIVDARLDDGTPWQPLPRSEALAFWAIVGGAFCALVALGLSLGWLLARDVICK